MLNIPNEVKALFKNGSAFKNFHVHFPNGENADLNNDDIVAESVQFTESICSKEVFQFGLSERSQIEFECVGVQNIFGMTIDCAIEICLELLEDETQFIADHPNTGNESFLDPQICTYNGRNMYRVPYGRFIIESCPRSQGAMKHRKVNAYSEVKYSNSNLSPVLSLKEQNVANASTLSADGRLEQNAFLLLAGETQNISGLTLTESTITWTDKFNAGTQSYYWTNDGVAYQLEVHGSTYGYGETNNINSLYRLTYEFNETALEQINTVLSYVEEHGGNVDEARTLINIYVYPRYDATFVKSANVSNTNIFRLLTNSDTGYFYGYFPHPAPQYENLTSCVFYPKLVTCKVGVRNGTSTTYRLEPVMNSAVLTEYAQTNADINSFRVGIKPTGTVSRNNLNTFVNGIDIYELGRGIAEITGQFDHVDRYGNQVRTHVTKTAPIAMTPAEYSELWWDEYNVEPVGRIYYKYYDFQEGAEQENVYEFGTGASAYEMTDNYFLLNMFVTETELSGGTVGDYVQTLLESYFVPYLSDISFTPVTLDALGLPYLEAGDYLEIDNADGGTVGTYILTRTLAGIQTLTDSIESKGGEVLGNG